MNGDHNRGTSFRRRAPAGVGFSPGFLVGKLLLGATRLLGRGGTTLPGRAALSLAPGLISSLGRQLAQGSILVTGTNGKTTTAYLLAGLMKQGGFGVVHNHSGSNLSWGIASSLIESSSWGGRLRGDLGVLEVDEGFFPVVAQDLRPRGVVVTNIFRDQLDRFGTVEKVREKIEAGLGFLEEGGFKVINADDPSLASLESSRTGNTWFYGLELPAGRDRLTGSREKTACPLCRATLEYRQVYLAHLGRYRCPSCRFQRPEPDLKLVAREPAPDGGTLLDLDFRGERFKLAYPLLGRYNLYNALAAISCALAMKVPRQAMERALAAAAPTFGRMERFSINGRQLVMALIKNAVGAGEVLQTILEQEKEPHLLLAINNKAADGTDISWLWEADFECLAAGGAQPASATVSGTRAEDMAGRLKEAGVAPDRIQVEKRLKESLLKGLASTPKGGTLYVLPTYTAMLEIRSILNRMGVGRPFWET